MDFNDFSAGSIWSIDPGCMDAIFQCVPRLFQNDFLLKAANTSVSDAKSDLTIIEGVAVIPVAGVISKNRGLFSMLFGGASVDQIRKKIQLAIDDPGVKGIVLYIDSPGGPITGVHDLAEYIYRLRKKKKIVAFSDGQMTSAATWIGSAASLKILSPTAMDGSIGVVSTHADLSKMDEKIGVKYTYLSAGKYKAVGNPSEPLGKEGRAIIEDQLSRVYEVFVDSMAKFRGVQKKTVLDNMADGLIFIGQTAVDAGLADHLGSMESAIEAASGSVADFGRVSMPEKIVEIRAASGGQAANPPIGDINNLLELADVHFGKDTAASFRKIVNSGISSDDYLVFREAIGADNHLCSKPDKNAEWKKQMLEALTGASALDPGYGHGSQNGPSDFLQAVDLIMSENNCSRGESIKIASREYPGLHRSYIQALNPAAELSF